MSTRHTLAMSAISLHHGIMFITEAKQYTLLERVSSQPDLFFSPVGYDVDSVRIEFLEVRLRSTPWVICS